MIETNRIASIRNKLLEYTNAGGWEVSVSSAETMQDLKTMDVSWRSIDPVYKMTGPGEYWFRKTVKIEERFQGIQLEGSQYRLGFFLVSPTEVYIDDTLVFREMYWADSKKPEILITDHAQPGVSHTVSVHVTSTEILESIGREIHLQVFIDTIENILFDIDTFIQELRYIREFPEAASLLEKAEEIIKEEINPDTTVHDLLQLIQKVRTLLDPVRAYTKKQTVHLVGHAHIDMDWLWPHEETAKICNRDFETVDMLLNRYPDLTFSQNQVSVYEFVRRENESLFAKVRQKIREGRWEVLASTWTEADLNLSDGESIARHILYSRAYTKDILGGVSRILWEPDTFGHPVTVPQIAEKSGIAYYYHFRCSPGYHLYWWEGLNGSRVLAFSSIYLSEIEPEKIAEVSRDLLKDNHLHDALFVYGVGDHGGGPTIRDIQRVKHLEQVPGFPAVRFSRAEDFFTIAASSEGSTIPVYQGELNPVFDGCYTSHADIKRLNRQSERVIEDYEKVSMLGYLRNLDYDEEFIEESWKTLFFNQFHDILAGCSIHATYDRACSELEELVETVRKAIQEKLKQFSPRIPGPAGTISAAVWNLQSLPRKDIVRVPLNRLGENVYPTGPDGTPFPAQTVEEELLFIPEIPSLGYSVFSFGKTKHESGVDTFQAVEENASSFLIENDFFLIELNKRSGTIVSLYDKQEDFAVVKPLDWRERRLNYRNNLFRVDYEGPQDMSSWIIGPIVKTEYFLSGCDIRLIHDGPVVKVFSLRHKREYAEIRQKMFIYKNLRRIDFQTSVLWKKKGNIEEGAPMLRVSFQPDFKEIGKAVYDIPFGNIERVNDGQEYPALKFVDLSCENYGVSILSDSKYGFHVTGNTISMTCLRSSYAPDPDPDTGEHQFKYAFYFHAGDFKAGNVRAQGYAFNSPLQTVFPETSSGIDDLPMEHSWLSRKEDGIEITCYKKALKDNALVIRLFEWKGESSTASIAFHEAVQSAAEISIPEDEVLSMLDVQDKTVYVDVSPYEVKTIAVYFGGP